MVFVIEKRWAFFVFLSDLWLYGKHEVENPSRTIPHGRASRFRSTDLLVKRIPPALSPIYAHPNEKKFPGLTLQKVSGDPFPLKTAINCPGSMGGNLRTEGGKATALVLLHR